MIKNNIKNDNEYYLYKNNKFYNIMNYKENIKDIYKRVLLFESNDDNFDELNSYDEINLDEETYIVTVSKVNSINILKIPQENNYFLEMIKYSLNLDYDFSDIFDNFTLKNIYENDNEQMIYKEILKKLLNQYKEFDKEENEVQNFKNNKVALTVTKEISNDSFEQVLKIFEEVKDEKEEVISKSFEKINVIERNKLFELLISFNCYFDLRKKQKQSLVSFDILKRITKDNIQGTYNNKIT